MKPKKPKITIFDTTLRDGEQSPGFAMNHDEKLKIAHQLADLGVDVIEAGFPYSSNGDLESVKAIAKEVGTPEGPIICGLARATAEDIQVCARAVESAAKPRIHTFIATSDIHVDKKFGKNREWVKERAVQAVEFARRYVDDVEFSTEDFGRSDTAYIIDIVNAAIDAGATTINLPDTVGYLMPHEMFDKMQSVVSAVKKGGRDAIFSVHCHDDFGNATANTIAAIRAGATQAEVTINGVGERAGNTALEEVVAIVNERGLGTTSLVTQEIGPTSRLLSDIVGISVQPNKAIVGANAFSHEAGIHQDGMIKDATTYEIMDPTKYGVRAALTYGPRSGSRAVREKIDALGIEVTAEQFAMIMHRYGTVADQKPRMDDADFVHIVHDKPIDNFYKVHSYQPSIGEHCIMNLFVSVGDDQKHIRGEGNGQLSAAACAIDHIVPYAIRIEDFREGSKQQGRNAVGVTEIPMVHNGWHVIGRGEHTDIVRSAIEAYVDGCNRLKFIEEYLNE